MAKVLKKIIINGVDYNLPSGGGGGGGDLDIAAANALIDAKLGNYNTLFNLQTGLYKILNWLSDEDELGLTAWDDRDTITSTNASMSLISHSYTVMVYVANSSDAMAMVCSKDGATKEVSECWNSISIIVNCEKAREIYLNSEYGNYYLSNYQVVQDAFGAVLDTLRGKQLLPFLTIDTYYTQIMNTPELKDSLSVCTLDDLTPAVCYYAELTGYETWDDITSDSTALNTVLNNSTCMEILWCSDQFMVRATENIPLLVNNQAVMEMVANSAALMDLCVNDSATMAAIAGSSTAMWEMAKSGIALNKIVKSSTAITEITKSANNSVLQAQKTTMYNTVVWDSTNFTQITRTYADGVSQLNNSTKTANCIVFTACGYWSSASSQKTNVYHANGVLAHTGSENYRPSSVAANTTNCVSFTNCTFTETNDAYAAIAVYQAK